MLPRRCFSSAPAFSPGLYEITTHHVRADAVDAYTAICAERAAARTQCPQRENHLATCRVEVGGELNRFVSFAHYDGLEARARAQNSRHGGPDLSKRLAELTVCESSAIFVESATCKAAAGQPAGAEVRSDIGVLEMRVYQLRLG